MDICHSPRIAIFQLFCNGGKGQEVIVLRLRLILLERLASAAHHIKFATVFQHIAQRVRLVLIGHKTGGECEVRGFHRGIAVIPRR